MSPSVVQENQSEPPQIREGPQEEEFLQGPQEADPRRHAAAARHTQDQTHVLVREEAEASPLQISGTPSQPPCHVAVNQTWVQVSANGGPPMAAGEVVMMSLEDTADSTLSTVEVVMSSADVAADSTPLPQSSDGFGALEVGGETDPPPATDSGGGRETDPDPGGGRETDSDPGGGRETDPDPGGGSSGRGEAWRPGRDQGCQVSPLENLTTLPVCKEEVSSEQRERSPSLVQVKPEPPQIKEELQETSLSVLQQIKVEHQEMSSSVVQENQPEPPQIKDEPQQQEEFLQRPPEEADPRRCAAALHTQDQTRDGRYLDKYR